MFRFLSNIYREVGVSCAYWFLTRRSNRREKAIPVPTVGTLLLMLWQRWSIFLHEEQPLTFPAPAAYVCHKQNFRV